MYKSLISVLAIATTVAGASLVTSNSASAFPKFPVGGLQHLNPNAFGGFGGGGGHGPVLPPGGFGGGYPHPHFGFDVAIVDDGGVGCGTAAAIVRANGFHGVQSTSCYTFTGFKHGALFDIDVSPSGRIANVSMD